MQKIICVILSVFFSLDHLLAQEKQVLLGVSAPLSGEAAGWGTDIKNILLFVNEKLAGNKYKLVFEDDRCNGKDAVTAAHKLIDIEKVRYTIGYACSGALMAAAPLFERSKIVVVDTAASAPSISHAGEYIFRTFPSDAGSASALFAHMSSKHKRIGLLTEQTEFCEGLLKVTQDAAKNSGVTVLNETYPPGNTDLRSIILKLKSQNVEGLFVNTQTEATFLTAVQQIRTLGWDVPLYSAYHAGSRSFLEKAGTLSEGIVFVDLPPISQVLNPEGQKLFEEFEKKFGKMSTMSSIFPATYEGFRALDLAISSGEDVREYLETTTFHGIFGEWSFDKNGDIQGLHFLVRKIEGGKEVSLQE